MLFPHLMRRGFWRYCPPLPWSRAARRCQSQVVWKGASERVVDVLRGTPDRVVTVKGWIRASRKQKRITFVQLNDGSCLKSIQVVVESGHAASLSVGASVTVTGRVTQSPKSGQPVELQCESLDIAGESDPASYPLQKKGHSFEFLREKVHLRPRTNVGGAVIRVRHALSRALQRTLDDYGFVQVHTPVLTSNDCEGAGEAFRVCTEEEFREKEANDSPFFGRPAYLTVSGQLQAEAFACSMSRVYTFGPTFRAENSNTTRHLAEFWMLEPEIAFADLDSAVTLAESCLQRSITALLADSEEDLHFFQQWIDATVLDRLRAASSGCYPRITYTEAIRVLARQWSESSQAGQSIPMQVAWGDDISSEQERFLCESVFGGSPVIVTHYPASLKPFYMRRTDDCDPAQASVDAFDILFPKVGEIVGGSAREERLHLLRSAMNERSMDLAASGLEWYADLRRYGSVPHAGWGLGFERLVLFATGLQNIRDAIPVPRVPGFCRL